MTSTSTNVSSSIDEQFLRWRLILGIEGEKKGLSLNDLMDSLSSDQLEDYLPQGRPQGQQPEPQTPEAAPENRPEPAREAG
ncbi:MAG: hypothetical protein ACXAEL_14550, partial [Candidatus Hodarchaeales archaeon]